MLFNVCNLKVLIVLKIDLLAYACRQQRQVKDLKEEIETSRKHEDEQKRRKEAAVSN